mgnify:CR=1 FL=1
MLFRSSSGHLILAREILSIQIEGSLAFDAVLHFATALAVAVYFRHELLKLIHTGILWVSGGIISEKNKVLLAALLAGTVPAVILGLLLEDISQTTGHVCNFMSLGYL